MKVYIVSQLAKMASVSVRTLHHYDHIGLLKPSSRTSAGYRLYEKSDLLRLQQILFFRELDYHLDEIRSIVDDPGFDQVKALESHRRLLKKRARRITSLLGTIDKTMETITEGNMKMIDEELYEGFTKKQVERYKREVREMYHPKLVEESEKRISNMSKAQWSALKAEGGEVAHLIAELMDKKPNDPEVQKLIARHHAWIEKFYPASGEIYRGLGQLYAEHQEFRKFYDKIRSGLADFMREAMAFYADHALMENREQPELNSGVKDER